jgi:hypothetical protein
MRVRLAAALSACLASACSYDFDQFARSAGAGSGGGAGGDAAAGGSDAAGGSITPLDSGDERSATDGAPVRETGADTGAETGADARADTGAETGAETGADVADAVAVVEAGPPDAQSDGPPVIGCDAYQGVVYQGHCYYVVATAADEATAELACSVPGFHLVTITSAAEQAAVTPLVSGKGDHWIGLSEQRSAYTQKNEANFRWTTGEPYKPATSYRNWAPSEPSFPSLGDCVVMRQTGQWACNVCNQSLPFVCERDF